MKSTRVLMLTLAATFLIGVAWAGDAPERIRPVEKVTPSDHKDANSTDANEPAESAVLATVGSVPIKRAQLENVVEALPKSIPAHKMDDIRQGMLDRLIFAKLTELYLSDKEVKVTDDEVDAFKMGMQTLLQPGVDIKMVMSMQAMTDESIATDIRLAKYGRKTITPEKIGGMIEKHPDWFNGTAVEASHILIKSDYTDASSDQKAARKKIEKIAKAIEDGKIGFKEAAEQYSGCPSSRQGGSLGSFRFHEMDPVFSSVAYKLKKGSVSDVVHTRFGFHLIQRTGSTPGEVKLEGSAMDRARKLARQVLQTRIRHEIGTRSMDTYPIKR